MAKKVFITGISGFAGSFLAEYLSSQSGYTISGTYLNQSSLKNVESFKDKINCVQVDLLEADRVKKIIEREKPDIVFHLAALSSPADSFKNPSFTITNNVSAQISVLEGLKVINSNADILIVSSADIYGIVSKDELPINENAPFRPNTPYAVSKITQDFLALQYANSYKMNIVRVRPFNHIGPRQSSGFVVSSFAQRIARIEKKMFPPVLKVGNLQSKRDFTDVRDMVRAYVLTLEKGTVGDVYNIGSGKSYLIEDILKTLVSFSSEKIRVEIDPSLLRPSDNPQLLCDNRKVKKVTGWEPKISIEQTLKETLDYWRNIV